MDEIKLKVESVPEKTMYLTQHLGNGTLGKTKFDASFALPTFSLIVSIGKQRYLVSSQSVIQAVIEMHKGKK